MSKPRTCDKVPPALKRLIEESGARDVELLLLQVAGAMRRAYRRGFQNASGIKAYQRKRAKALAIT